MGLEDFEDPIETPYDYVLIDSRTGYTEIGGLCIGPVADRLVVLTSLNTQSVEGTAQFLKDAGIELRARTNSTAPWDADDTAGTNALGPKPTILIASPVPEVEITLRRQRLLVLKEKLGLEALSIPYQPVLALQETIFLRDFADLAMGGVYAELTTRIMASVGDDTVSLSRRVGELIRKTSRNLQVAAESALRAGAHSPEVGIPMMLSVSGAEIQAEDWPSLRNLFATLAVHEADAASYHGWGNSLGAASRGQPPERGERLAERSLEVLELALSLAPDDGSCAKSIGATLLHWAHFKTPGQREQFLRAALKKYESLGLKNDGTHAYNFACFAAMLTEPNQAVEQLQIARNAKQLPPKAYILADLDFAEIHNHPGFLAFINSLDK